MNKELSTMTLDEVASAALIKLFTVTCFCCPGGIHAGAKACQCLLPADDSDLGLRAASKSSLVRSFPALLPAEPA